MYRLSLDASENTRDQLLSLALSPDGKKLALVMRDSGGITALWLRSLDSTRAVRIPGSERAMRAFFSPDGGQLAFFTESRLMRMSLHDLRAEPVVDNLAVSARSGYGVWMGDDEILFAAGGFGPLMRVSARGGKPTTAVKIAAGELMHIAPVRLADNRHFLFRVVFASGARPVTRLGSLDSPETQEFLPENVAAVTSTAAIVNRSGTLLAFPLDKSGLHVSGEPVQLVSEEGIAAVTSSRDGLLMYQRGLLPTGGRLQILDHTGHPVTQIGDHADGVGYDFYGPRVSPDGKKIAYEYHEGRGTGDLFIYDMNTAKIIRQTFVPEKHSAFVAWSPDSRTLIFESARDSSALYRKTLDGSVEQKLPRIGDVGFPTDWSPDGTSVFFAKAGDAGYDVYRTSPNGGASVPVITGPGNQINAVLSPDGKWIAYASDEQAGRSEVFVRRYPLTAEQWQVSKEGGEAPRWSRDGKTLYFLVRLPSVGVMSTPVTLGASFGSGEPTLLFRKSIRLGFGILVPTSNYDVTPSGQFVAVVMDSLAQTRPPSIGVIMNWTSKLSSAKR
jgi:Tol biopolymer transport system component